MNADFVFCSKIILNFVEISRKVLVGGKMSDQNWIIALNWEPLLLKTEVGINIINDPRIIENYIFCCNRGFLLTWHWWIECRSQRNTWKVKRFTMKVRVHLNLYFLTVSDDIIISEHVWLFNFLNNENRTCDWARMLLSYCGNKCLINSKSSCANINNHVSLCLLVCDYNWKSISQILILPSKWPWYFLVWLCNLW
jgi:hypothetical protein